MVDVPLHIREPDVPCETCGKLPLDHDFGQLIACLYDVPLEKGRDVQRRVVARLTNSVGDAHEG